MTEKSFVVVFPSTFSQRKLSLLMGNIKKILKIKNQQYNSIKKDGPIIIIDANDPVFTSSAVNLLFGISKVAIAKQIENNFDAIVSQVSKIGSNLLLKGDSFYVKVEGNAKGFLPKDLEMAATSSIIEKSSKLDAYPGTENNYNKLLYTFLTKSNAYVCIFSDEGLGGIPLGAHKKTILCPIFDELSAVSCIETIKQGFDVKIVICYRKESELSNLVKMINQIIPRTVYEKINLEFIKIVSSKGNSKNYLDMLQIVLGVTEKIAKKMEINHVALPISPLIFPSRVIDEFLLNFNKQKIITYIPLGALENEIYKNAKEIGLGKFVSNIENLSKIDFSNGLNKKNYQKSIDDALKKSKTLSVKIGPNNVHEILDQLIEEKN